MVTTTCDMCGKKLAEYDTVSLQVDYENTMWDGSPNENYDLCRECTAKIQSFMYKSREKVKRGTDG